MTGWTTADVPDCSGRTALVTGASSGLGRETAVGLARAGARVLLGCRDAARGERALGTVLAAVPGAAVEVVPLDLAGLAAVRRAADDVAGRVAALDLLVANAGVMALPRRTTVDGFELQIATNHLGHAALAGLLLPRLLAAPAPRVVAVSSGAHRAGRLDLDDLHGERRYSRWGAYGQSKLANLLFVLELQRRADAAGWPLLAAAAHPGWAATGLQGAAARSSGGRVGEALAGLANRLVAQSAEAGAWPVLYAATMPDVLPADYWGPGGPLEARGHPARASRSRAALDADAARRLWELTERLTGVRWPAGSCWRTSPSATRT
ncbi:MAG TPA: oxidoreductase, partial [Miltoncostaeaceae bacterium]|nr:oxidoreductase [Miltoncostaeaceae bacterium]